MRIKRAVHAKKKKRTLKKAVKGYISSRQGSIKRAKEAFIKAQTNAYKDRKAKKHTYRQLWQMRISAGVKQFGLSYSQFIHLLKEQNIILDRKILAKLASEFPQTFKAIVLKVTKQ